MVEKKPKLIVAGNAVEDIYILGNYILNENFVEFKSGGVTERFDVNNGPLRLGGKYKVDYPLEEKVKRLWSRSVAGGGGVNSIKALSSMAEIVSGFNMAYLDVSKGSDVVLGELKKRNIEHIFFGRRKVSSNLVIESKNRTILTGPYTTGWLPFHNDIINIYRLVQESKGFLINSVKDIDFIDMYVKATQGMNVPLYVVLTPAPKIDYEYFKNEVLHYAVGIVNYMDLAKLVGEKDIDEKATMNLAVETMAKMHEQKLVSNFYVTLNEKGVYCKDSEGIHYVMLKSKYAEKVNDFVESGRAKTTKGLGDIFAAKIFVDEIITNSIYSIKVYARLGCHFAIELGIGYGAINKHSFETRTLMKF